MASSKLIVQILVATVFATSLMPMVDFHQAYVLRSVVDRDLHEKTPGNHSIGLLEVVLNDTKPIREIADDSKQKVPNNSTLRQEQPENKVDDKGGVVSKQSTTPEERDVVLDDDSWLHSADEVDDEWWLSSSYEPYDDVKDNSTERDGNSTSFYEGAWPFQDPGQAKIYLVHVGKAGGKSLYSKLSTEKIRKAVSCRMASRSNGLAPRNGICLGPDRRSMPVLAQQTLGLFHMKAGLYKPKELAWLQRETNMLLFTVRDPIDRLVSAFNYHHHGWFRGPPDQRQQYRGSTRCL